MLEKIAKYITKKPNLLQIAKNEIWEDTWNINVENDSVSINDITQYLEKNKFKDLAIEAVFEEKEGVYVLGLEYKTNHLSLTHTEFLSTFIALTVQYRNFISYVTNINEKLLSGSELFSGEPDKIRIGVVNHWFSVGPCLIWEKGQTKALNESKLDVLLSKKPEVCKTKLNYQGMSFVYNLSDDSKYPCHWMKSPCSTYKNGTWILNKSLMLKYLSDWQEFLTD